MSSPVKIYVTKFGEKVSSDVAKIYGVEEGVTAKANLVGFLIEGGVISPEDLSLVEEEVKKIEIDTSKPVIISGRGPHWLYGVFVHNLHFARAVATWEPRKKVGILVEAPVKNILGKGITIDGKVVDVELRAKGYARIVSGEGDGKTILHLEIKGDRFIEPRQLASLSYPEIDTSKPLVIEGLMPIWLGARLASEYVHMVPSIAFYDPRIKGGVIFASHHKDYKVGQILPVKDDEIEKVSGRHETRVIGILGDPNSGKSVFLHILNDVLREKGYITLTQEADVIAPTQNWSLYSPEVRRELKKYMKPEERLKWILDSLAKAGESGSVDFVLADIGGGRPDLGQRITRENLSILQHVDGVIIVSRNDEGQIMKWIEEMKTYTPDIKIYSILESRLEGTPVFRNGYGRVVGLDRELYRKKEIPEGTIEVVRGVVERVVLDKYVKPVDIKETRSETLEERESVDA